MFRRFAVQLADKHEFIQTNFRLLRKYVGIVSGLNGGGISFGGFLLSREKELCVFKKKIVVDHPNLELKPPKR